MFSSYRKLVFILLISMFCSSISYADSVKKVFRASTERPEDVKERGGFIPRGIDPAQPHSLPTNINLWSHANSATGLDRMNSGYVSTTRSQEVAIRWVSSHLQDNGFVYHIRATPNFINVNGSLRDYSPFPQESEYAALGTVYWGQIIGWQRVINGSVGPVIRNPDYNRGLYQHLSSGGEQPQLAGFPAAHPAWASEPWVEFAHCELRANVRSACYPKESAQKFGEEWVQKANQLIRRYVSIIVIDN